MTKSAQTFRKHRQETEMHRKKPFGQLILAAVFVLLFIFINLLFTPEEVASSHLKSFCLMAVSFLTFFLLTSTALKFLVLLPKVRHRPLLIFFGTMAFFIIIRTLSIRLGFPKLLFSSVLFKQSCLVFADGNSTLGTLLIDSILILFLAFLSLKYLKLYRHNWWTKNQYTMGLTTACALLFTHFFFCIICQTIGVLVNNPNFIVSPDKILFFNVYSLAIVVISFCLLCSYSLLCQKVLLLLKYFVRHDFWKVLAYVGSTFLISVVVVILFVPELWGLPKPILILGLGVYLFSTMMTLFINRRRHVFMIAIGNILYFAFIAALFLDFFMLEREKELRENLISEIVQEDTSFASNDSIDTKQLDELFDKIYNVDESELGCSWVVKKNRYLNRHLLDSINRQAHQYSFAYYENGKLIDQYGYYDYKMSVADYTPEGNKTSDAQITRHRSFCHYAYNIHDGATVVISSRDGDTYDLWAAFSFFFIVYFCCYMTVWIIARLLMQFQKTPISLYNSLLWITLLAFLLISLFVCCISVHYSAKQMEKHRKEQISAKMGSIQMNFIRHQGLFEPVDYANGPKDTVNSLLEEMSDLFLVDINLYNLDGQLLFSSNTDTRETRTPLQAEVKRAFDEGNTYYYNKRISGQLSICELSKVIVDSKGSISGFASIVDAKEKNKSNFFLSYLVAKSLRIYFILIVLSLVAVMLVHFSFWHSLEHLFRAIKLRQRRKPIKLDWSETEEIGKLIKEHNQAMEELRVKAELLAKSERETAWRDMAQEIAHEIKNPLTPMRLKMQMLERAWQNRRPDFDARMKDTTREILSQVDTLTEVADTFSEFSSTQQSINKEENLRTLLNEFADSLNENFTTSFHFNVDIRKDYYASVDKAMFIKMLEYLVKNAKHNRKEDGKLSIEIALNEDADPRNWLLTFSSNDLGLDEEDIAYIFTVKFSAGNCGHSLCLPIVKNIVTGFSGDIDFQTSPETGTTFFIHIPKL